MVKLTGTYVFIFDHADTETVAMVTAAEGDTHPDFGKIALSISRRYSRPIKVLFFTSRVELGVTRDGVFIPPLEVT